MKKRSEGGLVFSTEQGRMCPDCRNPVNECTCTAPSRPAGDGIVRVSRETKGRKGKGVTLITGIPLDDKELKAYAKVLKAKCGTGGTVKDGVVETFWFHCLNRRVGPSSALVADGITRNSPLLSLQ